LNYFGKQHKVGEIELADEHFLLRFQRRDYQYINSNYISKIVRLNGMIDDVYHELYYMKREIEKMQQSKPNDVSRTMLWTYQHENAAEALSYFNDYERLEKHMENLVIQRGDISASFHNNTVRFHRDQTVRDKKFEPDESSEAVDLVVLDGVAQAAKQITHETIRTWDYFALGRSDIPAAFDDQDLQSPIGRYLIKTHGTFGAIGEVIRLLVVSPDDMATEDIGEIAVADAQTGGNILFRAVLDEKVHHTANEHFLATSANIYLASRR
jgi:hypothetical protein